nr:reverse transcriptase domain-containing protein [Tanacetum cinerariifolium]
MPPRRNKNIYDVYERIMAQMEERLDYFVDQFANRMNDMMNPRRRGDRNGRRSEGEESGNPFFEGDGSSLFVKCEEWEDDGPNFLIKMPSRRNKNIYDVYERIMARIEERLDHFVDQFANRMNDMMNPRRRGDRNGRRSEGEESKNLFFEGDGSSLFVEREEWKDDGVADDDYEEGPVFDDDLYKEDIELRREVEEFVSNGHIRKIMSTCAQPRGPLDLMSLYVSGSVPKKVQDFVKGLPYHGDSSDDDLVGNSRTNFVYQWGNAEGLSIEERTLLFLEAQDRVKDKA